jgi:hypothetical protein
MDNFSAFQGVPQFDAIEDQVIIALDFGTSCSGVAYAFNQEDAKPESIYDWPGVWHINFSGSREQNCWT